MEERNNETTSIHRSKCHINGNKRENISYNNPKRKKCAYRCDSKEKQIQILKRKTENSQ